MPFIVFALSHSYVVELDEVSIKVEFIFGRLQIFNICIDEKVPMTENL
jgi:hypothetical protein